LVNDLLIGSGPPTLVEPTPRYRLSLPTDIKPAERFHGRPSLLCAARSTSEMLIRRAVSRLESSPVVVSRISSCIHHHPTPTSFQSTTYLFPVFLSDSNGDGSIDQWPSLFTVQLGLLAMLHMFSSTCYPHWAAYVHLYLPSPSTPRFLHSRPNSLHAIQAAELPLGNLFQIQRNIARSCHLVPGLRSWLYHFQSL
jgi:hypothetical protein